MPWHYRIAHTRTHTVQFEQVRIELERAQAPVTALSQLQSNGRLRLSPELTLLAEWKQTIDKEHTR